MKSWQVFVFSLIPLALVLAGVIIGSVHFSGGDSKKEILPTPRPQSSALPPAPVPALSFDGALGAFQLTFGRAGAVRSV